MALAYGCPCLGCLPCRAWHFAVSDTHADRREETTRERLFRTPKRSFRMPKQPFCRTKPLFWSRHGRFGVKTIVSDTEWVRKRRGTKISVNAALRSSLMRQSTYGRQIVKLQKCFSKNVSIFQKNTFFKNRFRKNVFVFNESLAPRGRWLLVYATASG